MVRKRTLQFTFTVLLFFLASTLSAQKSETDSLLNLSLEELLDIEISTASRLGKTEQRVPAIINSYDKDDIEKMGVTSFIDILKNVPSVETSLGPGGRYRVSFRGIRQDGIILCLLNGQPINNPYDGFIYYDIPYEQIQKIEIIRGSGSAVYGNNAALGVINIITNRTNNDLSVKVGTNGTYGANSNLHFSKFDSDIYLNLGHYQTDGPTNSINQDNSSLEPWSLTYQNKNLDINRSAKNYYLNGGVKSKNLTLNVNGFSNQNSSYVGNNFIAAPESNYKNEQLLANAKYDYKISKKIIITPKIYGNLLRQNNTIQETPNGFVSNISNDIFENGKLVNNEYGIYGFGGEFTTRFELNDNINFIIGNLFERQTIQYFNVNRNYQISTDKKKDGFANYDNLKLFERKRERSIFAYFFETDIKLNKFSFLLGSRFDNYSDFGQNINPRVSLIYNPNKQNYFKLLYGTAFRAPTFKELYDQSNLGVSGTKGNSKLKPQRISSFEAEYGFILDKVNFKASIFTNNISQQISEFDTLGNTGAGMFANTGFTESFGADFEICFPITKKLNFRANYSSVHTFFFWDSKLTSSFFSFIQDSGKKEITNIPQTKINIMFDYSIGKWKMYAGLNYGSSASSNLRTPIEAKYPEIIIPSYMLASFSFSYQPTTKIIIKAAANNIGTKYSDPDQSYNIGAFGNNGLIQPRETYIVSVKYMFNK